MADLVVVVPSRGRPGAAQALIQHFKNTCTADTLLAIAVDDDDPMRSEYLDIADGVRSGVLFQPTHSMGESLNRAAVLYAGHHSAVGFMGDDHMPRTVGWDQFYIDALREMGTGIVYGNDLLQGSRLPTQCAMTSNIISTLGYMAPPELIHLWLDNTWLRWGKAIGRLRYLPDVIVEHRHPLAGKAAWDENYERVNRGEIPEKDAAAFEEYMRTRFDSDVAKLKALL